MGDELACADHGSPASACPLLDSETSRGTREEEEGTRRAERGEWVARLVRLFSHQREIIHASFVFLLHRDLVSSLLLVYDSISRVLPSLLFLFSTPFSLAIQPRFDRS